jgi:hypothetical protein
LRDYIFKKKIILNYSGGGKTLSLLFIDKEKGVFPEENLSRSEFIIVDSLSSSTCSFTVAKGVLKVSGMTPSLLSSSVKFKISLRDLKF